MRRDSVQKALKSLTLTGGEYKCYIVAFYGRILVKDTVEACRQTFVSCCLRNLK